jgi:hypothetical protein
MTIMDSGLGLNANWLTLGCLWFRSGLSLCVNFPLAHMNLVRDVEWYGTSRL